MKLIAFHMSTLGDLLFSLPALEALRTLPDVHLTSVVPAHYVELLATTRLADSIVPRAMQGGWKEATSLFGRLRNAHYDTAVCFSQSRGTAIQAVGCGATRRVGFANSRWALLLTERVRREGPPSLANDLRLVEHLGCTPRQRDYLGFIQSTSQHKDQAGMLLRKVGIAEAPFAVIATGASAKRSLKEWTLEGFAEVIRHLTEDRGLRCVTVGTEPPTELLERSQGVLADLCGQTSLVQLAALLQLAALFVGIDSGVMHLAAAMGTPVVGIFGPTSPVHTGPLGERSRVVRRELLCSPCMSSWCRIRTRECLEQLAGAEVIAALNDAHRN